MFSMNTSEKKYALNRLFSAPVVVSLLFVVGVFGLFLLMKSPSTKTGTNDDSLVAGENVSIVDGKQIIELRAKGRYQPFSSTAKAGIPTVLKVNTSGTFDCSSALRIPSMNISQALPPSGVTEIALGTLKEGVLQGTCGMGMYPFQINVQS